MGKKKYGHLFFAVLLCAFLCTGCTQKPEPAETKGQGGALTPTGFPGQTETQEPTGLPEPIRPAVATGTPVPTKAQAPVPTNAPTQVQTGETSAQPAGLVTVTPVPQAAVKEIAGSIATADYPAVDGSTATLPLSRALYSLATGADEAAAEAAVVHTKTTNSYYQLYDGKADLLIVYEPPQEIIDRMQKEELLIKPIGLDALVFMANAGNPVQSLTTKQLIDIYSGKIKNWEEVGGGNQELLAFQRPAGSGSQTLMQKLVMGDVPMEEGDNIFRYSTMADILEGMIAYSGEANTLGYSVFYYAYFMYSLPELRFMAVDGVVPSTQTIYDGSYPFVNAFYAVIRPDEPEDSNARLLFDWLTGEAGQQMVLDLGYVPVTMPGNAQIAEKEPGRAGEPEVTPKENLAPGEHYILEQNEPAPTNNYYGDVWIYDENWNCTASFRNAYSTTHGVTDERYVEIYRWRTEEGREDPLYVYDFEEGKFLDFSGITSGEVGVLDGRAGYFKDYVDWSYMRVIDRDGKVLLDDIRMGEEEGMIWREGQCYRVTHWAGDTTGGYEAIYDLDLLPKTIAYENAEDMPEEKDRLDGVEYVCKKNGCVLSLTGEVLLTPELFLEAFGNGKDTECSFSWGGISWEWESEGKWLHEINYAGQTWYVDAQCNAYITEGETTLHFLDPKKADGIYVAWMQDKKRYFLSDGSLLVPSSFHGEAEDVKIWEDGSYFLAAKSMTGYLVELHMPGKEGEQYLYESPNGAKYSQIEGMEPCVVALKGAFTGEDGERKEELSIYAKDQRKILFTAQEIYMERLRNWNTNEKEDVWLVRMFDGKTQELNMEGKEREFCTYALVKNGELLFTTPVEGECVFVASHGGYLQMDTGNDTYVYDYGGNQMIKAYNRFLTEE